jgi:drug/metabolite transporter (DMT)-like permease
MHSAILRAFVFLAAAGVIAAATHANVMHAGGYGSRDAPLIIALAVMLALGMAFVGVCFKEGRRWQAILLAVLILAGEALLGPDQRRPGSREFGCPVSARC